MNPRLGHEVEPEYTIEKAVRSKRVLVIGGGPAGMECALTAAKRGHEVILHEAGAGLGGQMLGAAKEIGGGDVFLKLVDYYAAWLELLGVEVHLNSPVDRRLVEREGVDVCVVATGSHYPVPPEWTEKGGPPVVDVMPALTGNVEIGNRVVVIGGQRAGLVAAEHLASAGHEVEIVEAGKRLAGDVVPTFKWRHNAWLTELSLSPRKNTRVLGIEAAGVRVSNGDGHEQVLPADTVIVSSTRRSNDALITELDFSADELYAIGDAVAPRSMHNAVHDGYRLGVRI